jgi:predicted GIY-YIG superfamily endonuclease
MEASRELLQARRSMKQHIIDAFLEVRAEHSLDAVIADPDLNCRFLAACRRRRVKDPDEALNRELLNARKAGGLRGIKSKRHIVKNQENYRFACEASVRFLERRDGVTLDQILCNPEKAREFDRIANDIAPGFSSFEYRWAALGLRKRRMLKPELVSKVMRHIEVTRFKVSELDVDRVPSQQGVYLFHDSSNTLYAGEATNLYKRVRKHLDHSDSKGLAQWLWQHGAGELHLELHVLPKKTSTLARKALEAEIIRSRKPLFNIAGIDR